MVPPDLYHRVLSYSGTFVDLRNSSEAPLGAYEYIEHLFPGSEKRPYRIWIQVSENDNGSKTPSDGRRNWVIANARLAKILKDKGYAYQFLYSKGAGHTQRKVINSSLPQALDTFGSTTHRDLGNWRLVTILATNTNQP